MKQRALNEWLQAELQKQEEPNCRYIVRFNGLDEYQNGLNQLAPRLIPPSCTPDFQPIEFIQAFSCSRRMIQHIESLLPQIDSIEIDRKEATIYSARELLIPWGVRHIRAPEVWRRSTGSRVKIGIIDTGIDYSHPDLQRSVNGGVNLIHRYMLPMDDNGHGTHIAGTIAAASLKSGIVGVAPQGSLHAVKAFDYNGTAYVSDIVQGIEWCVRNRMDIINMSFGMKNHSKALEAAVMNAFHAGKVIVASSGNNGKTDKIDYPARFPQTISVGATTRTRRIAPFSNRGNDIDIYAPGEKIYSTWLQGRYNELSGTSMATSHVTGVIALMLSAEPTLTTRQIRAILRKNALALGLRKNSTNHTGEVSAFRTLKSIVPS